MGILKKITAVILLTIAVVFSVYFFAKFKDIGNVYLFRNEKVVIIKSSVIEEKCVIGSGKIGGNAAAVKEKICFIPEISYYSEKYGQKYIGSNIDFFIWNKNYDKSKAQKLIEKYKENSTHLAYFNVRDEKIYSWLDYKANFFQLLFVIGLIVGMFVLSIGLLKNKNS